MERRENITATNSYTRIGSNLEACTRGILSRRSGILPLAIGLLPIAFGIHEAGAASIILSPPAGWNGFYIEANIEAGFKQNGGPGSSTATASTARLVVDYADGSAVTPGYEFNSSPIALSIRPSDLAGGSGAPKDIASGALIFSYKVGSLAAGSGDTLSFNIAGTTSAMNAYHDFGSGPIPADAYFKATLTVLCFGPIPAHFGATLTAPALPSLADPTQESIRAITSIAGETPLPFFITDQGAGDPAVAVPLTMTDVSSNFKYELVYEVRTPFGTDPDFNYQFVGGSSVIPECQTAMLALVAAGTLASRRSRR